MKSIWKYPLNTTDTQTLDIPKDAQLLTVQIQHGTPTLWALVNVAAPKEKRIIDIVPTGADITDDNQRIYIATVQMSGGDLVWHFFERL